ncbi:helix-turn-helix domain-containing protein [Gibbsiella quercinecans]|uniref:helix-turn-helix domain-containing protein n=1 Tax=Gibbsiella quercinecans TaxID=929813 RepID=UPI000EF15B91|nr:helix-turn-helix transcriptional regulator [Gibbsiella quercinecans]RLM12849.1 hypothetical protein BIY31_00250 [Gibbsiella quercinecans]
MQKDIGRRLKEVRERLDLSQEAFGEIGGVKKLAQLKYEKGDRVPDADYLARLSNAGIDILYIISGVRSVQPDISPEEQRLVENYRAMDDAARLNIQAVGDAFAQSKPKLNSKTSNGE